MTVKLAVIFSRRRTSGWLTRLFTGCYAYHVAWVDEEAGLMWDMHLIRRRRAWPHYPEARVRLFETPAPVTREYLEEQLTSDEQIYGWRDYALFALRPLYHLLGRSTRNAGGVICSEMINNDIWTCGGTTPWQPSDAPPSPCDLYRWLNKCALGARDERRHLATC